MSEKHFLALTAKTDEHVQFTCPVCGRCVQVGFDGELTTINTGDQFINHGFASTHPGLSLSSSVEPKRMH